MHQRRQRPVFLCPGLLDFESDILYIGYEDFHDGDLRTAAIVVLLLPLLVVAAGFWAAVTINYKGQKWRLLLILVEGPLMLLNNIGFLTFAAGFYATNIIWFPALAFNRALRTAIYEGMQWFFDRTLEVSDFLKVTIYDNMKRLYEFTYVTKTEVKVTRRGEDNAVRVGTKHTKFFQQGILQLFAGLLLVPLALLLAGLFGGVFVALLWLCSGTALFLAGLFGGVFVLLAWLCGGTAAFLATIAGSLAATFVTVALPVVFSTMALLRLYMLFPAAWEAVGRATVLIGLLTDRDMSSSEDEGCVDRYIRFVHGTDKREAYVKEKIFNIFPADTPHKRDVSDVKKAALTYLLVEFALESVPQIIIQAVNNEQTDEWSGVAIASMAFSAYAILNTLYKYVQRATCNLQPCGAAYTFLLGRSPVCTFCEGVDSLHV